MIDASFSDKLHIYRYFLFDNVIKSFVAEARASDEIKENNSAIMIAENYFDRVRIVERTTE